MIVAAMENDGVDKKHYTPLGEYGRTKVYSNLSGDIRMVKTTFDGDSSSVTLPIESLEDILKKYSKDDRYQKQPSTWGDEQ